MKTRKPTQKARKSPPVRCAHDRLADPSTLVGQPRNPNTHPREQVELLARVIEHQGWRSPVVVSTRSGFVVTGHGRLMAARLRGWKVPVNDQAFASEAEEYAHLIADNRLAELAETNEELLASLLREIKEEDFDELLTGFDGAEIADLLSSVAGVEGNGKGSNSPTARDLVVSVPAAQFEKVKRWLAKIRDRHRLGTTDRAAVFAIREMAESITDDAAADRAVDKRKTKKRSWKPESKTSSAPLATDKEASAGIVPADGNTTMEHTKAGSSENSPS